MQLRSKAPSQRIGAALAATTALALLLTGCSAGSSTDSGGSPTELSISVLREPQTFNLVNLSEGGDAYIWSSIYDTLLKTDSDGAIVPNAASAFEYSEDGLTLTLTLRDDLEFSDGEPVTSADVKTSLETLMTTAGPHQGKVSSIATVAAPDDSTVVISLNAPDASLLSNLTFAVGVIADPDTIDEAQNPIGSGPYTLDTAATTQGATYVLDRRDDYWDAESYPFEQVTVKVISDPTATENALRSGELNIASVPGSSVTALEGEGYTTTRLAASNISNLKILDREGTVVPALADVRVRQAINMAFDSQAIIDGILVGVGTPTDQMFAPGQAGYVEKLNDEYPFDVKKAKALIADAGYPEGFSVTMPSLVYTTAIEPTVTQALADIGITVDWESVPASDTASAVMGKYAMAVWPDGINTPGRIVSVNYAPEGFTNPFGSTDPELTELLNEYATTVDVDAQTPILEKINTFVVDNAWDAPLYFGGQDFAMSKGYTYLGTTASLFSTLRQFGVAE